MTDHEPEPTRRTVLRGLGGLAGITSLAGCTSLVSGAESSGGDSGSTFRYAQALPPVTLDPVSAVDPWTRQVTDRVFDGLYAFGSGTDVVPQLASGAPKRDESGTTYRVSLREGATFHDGTPVTAADVKYSFDAPVAEDAPPKWALDPIDEIRVRDEQTVEFRLDHPYPPFTYALTRPIVPKHARSADRSAFESDPVGSGPFEVERFGEGAFAELGAVDDYWNGATSAVDRVRFVGTHAGLARSMSLRTGQNDVVERVQPKLSSVTEEMPDTRVERSRSLNSFFLGFNCNAGPAADPRVRKAIDHLLDVDSLVDHFVSPTESGERGRGDHGAGREGPEWRQYGPFPNHLAREWDFPLDEWRAIPAERDEERAKELLDEAGVDSWHPKIAAPKDKMREKFADAVAHELSKVGFSRARTVTYNWPEFREKLSAGSPSDFDAFVGSWSGWPDPDSFLYPLFHENLEGVTNFTFYQDEDVMNRIRRGRETTGREERRRRYRPAIRTLLEDRVHLPLFTLHNTFGVDASVDGFDPHTVSHVDPQFVAPDGTRSLSK